MKNMAGKNDADSLESIRRELALAGIPIVVVDPGRDEVPSPHGGLLHGWEFSRAWVYWRAKCVSGTPLRRKEAEALQILCVNAVRPSGDACGRIYDGLTDIASYHVDTQEGLDFFAAYLRYRGNKNANVGYAGGVRED